LIHGAYLDVAVQLLIAVATYNEIDSLPRLVDEVFHYAPTADLLVVDDNSPDGTGRWLAARAAAEPRLRSIHRSGKLGLGTATIAALRYAIEHDYEYVINMDADLSHHPRDIPRLLAGMDSAEGPPVDVTIGSRYVQGGAIEGWPPQRHVMSRAVNLYARSMLGLSCRDCSGAFRCYRVAQLRQLDFATFRAHGYAFLEELLWHLQRNGCRFAEVPITFVNRVEGESKINAREAVSALWTILRLGVTGWFGGSRRE
jgi:dolichol-phosphate mannosyltransferase